MKRIELPDFGIVVKVWKNGGGEISASNLQDKKANLAYRTAVDVLEGLVLAHACSGIDIESPAYLEGIETVADAIFNEYT